MARFPEFASALLLVALYSVAHTLEAGAQESRLTAQDRWAGAQSQPPSNADILHSAEHHPGSEEHQSVVLWLLDSAFGADGESLGEFDQPGPIQTRLFGVTSDGEGKPSAEGAVSAPPGSSPDTASHGARYEVAMCSGAMYQRWVFVGSVGQWRFHEYQIIMESPCDLR